MWDLVFRREEVLIFTFTGNMIWLKNQALITQHKEHNRKFLIIIHVGSFQLLLSHFTHKTEAVVKVRLHSIKLNKVFYCLKQSMSMKGFLWALLVPTLEYLLRVLLLFILQDQT